MDDPSLIEIIDTHAHLDMVDFQEDLEELLVRTREGVFPEIRGKTIENGSAHFSVTEMILPGITAKSSRRAAELAGKNPELYAGAGVHPNHLLEMEQGDWDSIVALAEDDKTKAIGETGLDLYWKTTPIELQCEYLIRHCMLAKRTEKPIIVHCREAESELLKCLMVLRAWEAGEKIEYDEWAKPLLEPEGKQIRELPAMKGTIHSYSGSPETASELIELGFHLGFTGSVTFTGKKFAQIGETAARIPDERILLETDSPFLTPHPFRGKLERNEPLMSAWTARRLAELRGSTVHEIAALTAANARRLFGLLG